METTKEMRIMELLGMIEQILDEGKPAFLSGNKITVDKEEILDCLHDIQNELPSELKHAIWIVEERNKILAEAQEDAEVIRAEATDTVAEMIDEHTISTQAEHQAQIIIETAQQNARDIHIGAMEHANAKFKDVEQKLKVTLDIIHQEVYEFENYVSDLIHSLQQERMQVKDSINKQQYIDG
ncbi:MAG: hypothetical protein ATN36_05405 [Epulopiscium sp. Nele67-Bin005]|nr:MAG: hypothetical protein ATN36_05405 [Epulopiscium sp. Nele67-Bin005]